MKLIKSLAFRFIFVAIFFLSSFAGTPGSDHNMTAPGKRISTARILEQLGGVPCSDDSDFTCVTLEMPLDHFNPADARTISVTFAVLPASGSRKGMFVVATGGPGTSGIAVADGYVGLYNRNIPRRFDIVFFDQRGVGLSGGLACPQSAVQYYRRDVRTDSIEQKIALASSAQTFSTDCVNEAGTTEILPYLGTAQAVEDLEYFRQLMQDPKFWLYGESYGTQYAQTYAAKYDAHLSGLILDGTVDLTLTGFEYYAGQAQAFNDTLTQTLEACNDDAQCLEDLGGNIRAARPNLEDISDSAVDVYDYAVARLKEAPIQYDFPLPDGGYEERFFALADLENVAASQMYTEGDRMMFNRALASSAAYGNVVPMARLLNITLGLDPQTQEVIPDSSYSDAIFFGVECQDYGYPGLTLEEKVINFFAAGDQVVPTIPRLGSVFYGDMPCVFWPDATTQVARPAPLTTKVPTLVLNATADPATPLSNAMNVYKRLKNGYLITQEGGPHVIFGWGNACPDNLVTNFLVNNRLPAKRITHCAGVTVEDYVPVSPTDASEFENRFDAFSWTETELNYLPEYYYWDGFTPTQIGCPLQGTLAFEAGETDYLYTFNDCAFAAGFTLTGTGSYNPVTDKFILEVVTDGRWQCDITYTRAGARTTVAGTCDGKIIKERGKALLPIHTEKQVLRTDKH